MEEILHACYTASLEERGRKTMQSLSLTACPGENLYFYGAERRCQLHFEVLCGLRKPDHGTVAADGQDLYSLPAQAAAAVRRDRIGAIPRDGGLIAELPMVTQVVLPMKLAGYDRDAMLSRLQELVSDKMPLHSLYNPPSRSAPRKQAYAAIFRAVLQKPKVIVINGFLDGFEELDADALWETLLSFRPKDSVLLYLSGAPAPERIHWTQKWKL